MTVSYTENVSAVETGQGQRMYTIATEEEHVVVNSIIVSPFAFNHIVANLYCNIHRFVNVFAPGLLNSPLVHSASEVLQTPHLLCCHLLS